MYLNLVFYPKTVSCRSNDSLMPSWSGQTDSRIWGLFFFSAPLNSFTRSLCIGFHDSIIDIFFSLSQTVCGKRVAEIAGGAGNATRIPWCPAVVLMVHQVLAHYRLTPSNLCTKVCHDATTNEYMSVFQFLCRQTNCWHPSHPQFHGAVHPKLAALARRILTQLDRAGVVVVYALRGSSTREVYWPTWTRAWSTEGWNGDFRSRRIQGVESLRAELREVEFGGALPELVRRAQLEDEEGEAAMVMMAGVHASSGTQNIDVQDEEEEEDLDDDDNGETEGENKRQQRRQQYYQSEEDVDMVDVEMQEDMSLEQAAGASTFYTATDDGSKGGQWDLGLQPHVARLGLHPPPPATAAAGANRGGFYTAPPSFGHDYVSSHEQQQQQQQQQQQHHHRESWEAHPPPSSSSYYQKPEDGPTQDTNSTTTTTTTTKSKASRRRARQKARLQDAQRNAAWTKDQLEAMMMTTQTQGQQKQQQQQQQEQEQTQQQQHAYNYYYAQPHAHSHTSPTPQPILMGSFPHYWAAPIGGSSSTSAGLPCANRTQQQSSQQPALWQPQPQPLVTGFPPVLFSHGGPGPGAGLGLGPVPGSVYGVGSGFHTPGPLRGRPPPSQPPFVPQGYYQQQ